MGVLLVSRAWAGVVALVLALAVGGCTFAPPVPSNVATSKATPSSTPTEGSSSASAFVDGNAFDADCAIAWPTEPVVSETSIQLTLTCPSVPSSDYVFVVAVYGDPGLAVTRDTTTVHVVGTVSDTALTNTGLSYLIVAASSVTL